MPSNWIDFTKPPALTNPGLFGGGKNPFGGIDFSPKDTTIPGARSSPISSIGSLVGAPNDPLNPSARGMAVPDVGGGGASNFFANGGAQLAGAGASALFGLFADNPAKTEATGERDLLNTLAKSLSGMGDKLNTAGMDTLQPVIKYLNSLLSGNPADVTAATAPERAMVLDQYDTAFRNIERNAPRGGGQVSAIGDLEAKKASTLATLPAEARRNAATQAAQLGASLTGQGVAAQAYAGNEISAALQAAQRAAEAQTKTNEDAGSGIGSAIATGLQLWAATGFAT